MFVLKCLLFALSVICIVNGVPVVFKETSPRGQSIVSISSSDPNVEKYFRQQFSTRSGFTEIDDNKDNRQNTPGTVHSSIAIAAPGNAVAGSARSFASASSGPFMPLFAFPINPEFNDFPDLKDWLRSVESLYNPYFAGNGPISTATAVSDNGRVYGKVDTETYGKDPKSLPKYDYSEKTYMSKIN